MAGPVQRASEWTLVERTADDRPVLDAPRLLARVEGDVDLLREMTRLFLADCPRWLAEVRQAIGDRDAGRLQGVAHNLKGAVSNFAAPAATARARELEALGRSGDLTAAPRACAALDEELARLGAALTACCAGVGP
jgi:HPt (histidine-containing phosphotransfer) domain-containing protein